MTIAIQTFGTPKYGTCLIIYDDFNNIRTLDDIA